MAINIYSARLAGLAGVLVASALLAQTLRTQAQAEEPAPPPEVAIGKRLFLETRFAQFYAAHSNGNPNAEPLSGGGDPVVNTLVTPTSTLPGPFAGRSMSCRQCHLVNEAADSGGLRIYNDFAPRSPIPERSDGEKTVPRNSPALVNLALHPDASAEVYHFDGEFETLADLTKSTFTGRNFGWLPTEHSQAVRHIAAVVRGDDGKGELARAFGGSYADVFAGRSSIVLPEQYRLDVSSASDTQILDGVSKLVAAYVDSLELKRNAEGSFTGSPYDVFIQKNGLPCRPAKGESELAYSRRLAARLVALDKPQYVTPADGKFTQSDQPFVFGALELAGLKVFLRELAGATPTADEQKQGGVGNCLVCHPAPVFTDFRLHNIGVAQEAYDDIHGEGSFARLAIPSLSTRKLDYNAYLPATPQHPDARGPFRRPPTADNSAYTDLGAWNVYLNPDFGVDTARLEKAMGLGSVPADKKSWALSQAVGRMKTPGLRNLASSNPYLHNGSRPTIESVIGFYAEMSAKAQAGLVRNADPELGRMALNDEDVAALSAFLRSLQEDFN